MPYITPDIPTGLVILSGNAKVLLNWTAPVDSNGAITYYNIYRSATEIGTYSIIDSTQALNYTDYNVTYGQTYYYQVSAVNSVGEGQKSIESSGTPVPPSTIPSAPQSLTATTGNAQVVLTWSLQLATAAS